MNSLMDVCISWYSSVPWYSRNMMDETLPKMAALINAADDTECTPLVHGPTTRESLTQQCKDLWCFHTRASQHDNDKTHGEPVHSYEAFHME